MTNPNLLTVCKASAGSGKTFTLAVNYIALVVMNPEAYRKILAVTFTNKATGEMKDRILSQLYGIAHSLPTSDDCLHAVMDKLAKQDCRYDIAHRLLDERQARENAGKALTSILHNYSFFRIETIDSFMLGILRNMAKELQLGHNMDIELDQKKMIHNGVHDLIKGLKTGAHEMTCILQYITESIDNEKAWDVRDELERFASDLYRESYLRHSEELDHLLSNEGDTLTQLRKEMEQRRKEAEEITQGYVDHFFEMADSLGAQATDFGYGATGPWGFFQKIRNGELPEVGSRVRSYAERGKSWAGAKTPLKKIIEGQSDGFCSLLQEMLPVYERQRTVTHTTQLVLGNLYQLQLMGSIDRKIKEECRLSNRFLLADTCLMLKRMNTGPSDTSFIYEKTGTEYDHLLIDEFQDTSGLQWENFRPLLDENTSRGRQNLIVGDVKQSIYRWRDSDAQIMSKRIGEDFGHVSPVTQTLDTNYRSRQHIVEFNNRFFTTLVERLAGFTDECDCTDITRYFSDVCQHWKANHTGGYVDIRQAVADTESTAESSESAAKDEAMCRATVSAIVEMLDKGLQQKDIAILTRNNKSISLLASWIAAHPDELGGHALRLVSGEAFKLGASEMLSLLISALRWLCHDDDLVALLNLAHAWHALVAQDSLPLSAILDLPEGRYGLPEALFDRREELTTLPLTRQLYALCDILRLTSVNGHDAWLQTFFDVAQQYAAKENGSTQEFLAEWDERLSALAIPSGESNGIQAMTIHKAKGLEFHTVIVPFCDWKFEPFPTTQWIETGESAAQFQQMPCLPVKRCGDMKDSAFKEAYREETKQIWIDNLNLLYVAFTRPTTNLIVIRGAEATALPPKTASDFIDLGLKDNPHTIGEVCTMHFEKNKTCEQNPLNPSRDSVPVAFHATEPRLVFRQSNSSRTYISRQDDSPLSPFIEQGNLLHEVFAHIATADDAPRAVEALFTQGVIDASQREEISALVADALSQEEAKAWFDGRYTLFNECTILTPDSDGGSKQCRPDRVMTDGARTLVIDFKFGQPKKKHEEQVRDYMQLLTDMGFPQVEGYLWYVRNKEIIRL